jgi:hypothetical protein
MGNIGPVIKFIRGKLLEKLRTSILFVSWHFRNHMLRHKLGTTFYDGSVALPGLGDGLVDANQFYCVQSEEFRSADNVEKWRKVIQDCCEESGIVSPSWRQL